MTGLAALRRRQDVNKATLFLDGDAVIWFEPSRLGGGGWPRDGDGRRVGRYGEIEVARPWRSGFLSWFPALTLRLRSGQAGWANL